MKIVALVRIKKCYGVLRKSLKQKDVTVYDRSAKRFRSIIDIGTLSNIVGEHSELIGISKSNLIRKMCNIELVHETPDPVHRSGAAYRLAFTDSREPIDVEEFKGFVPEKK